MRIFDFSKKKARSIAHYLMSGPEAIEARLVQLEKRMKLLQSPLVGLDSLRARLAKADKVPAPVVTGLRRLAALGTASLAELKRERDALKTFVGEHLKPWETGSSGPAPQI